MTAHETRRQAIIGGTQAALGLGPSLVYTPRTTEQRLNEVAQRIERAYLKVTGHDRR